MAYLVAFSAKAEVLFVSAADRELMLREIRPRYSKERVDTAVTYVLLNTSVDTLDALKRS